MSGIPRSASVIASGQSGIAGHAIAVKLRGSTYLGCCPQAILVKIQKKDGEKKQEATKENIKEGKYVQHNNDMIKK